MEATFSEKGSSPSSRFSWPRLLSMFQDATLVFISALFFYVHASHVVESGNFTNVFFAIEQGLLVGMFLTRRRSEYTSSRPMDWVVATLGGWMPLLMRPHELGGTAQLLGASVQIAGLLMVFVSFSTLGRSFGVVAANRGLKVGGPYRLVRHPIYFAHTVTLTGFLMANFWWYNLTIFVLVAVFQVLRIAAEERVLVATTPYESYRARVRYRLIPGLY